MPQEMTEWAIRIFGSVEAFQKSLPNRNRAETSLGWASHDRSRCAELHGDDE